jgi:hypothetical protein
MSQPQQPERVQVLLTAFGAPVQAGWAAFVVP